ncbi:hypothetical protein [Actibacterium sp. D379-3]
MPKYLVIPEADGDDLTNAQIFNTPNLTGLANGTSYLAYRLSAASDPFIPQSQAQAPFVVLLAGQSNTVGAAGYDGNGLHAANTWQWDGTDTLTEVTASHLNHPVISDNTGKMAPSEGFFVEPR